MPRADRSMALGQDAVAEIYNDAWPPYPAALFDTLVEAGGLSGGARILEVGAGTGLATLPLAERGFSIVGLEPGPRLAAEARERLARFDRVTIEEAPFEDWPLPSDGFDALVSAQAFHWIDPEIAVAKAARALKPAGTIGLFWRRQTHRSAAIGDAIQRVHESLQIGVPGRGQVFETANQIRADLEASGLFGDVAPSHESEHVEYDAARFRRLSDVMPGYRALPDDTRGELLDRLERIAHDHGGVVPLTFETMLLVARKKRSRWSWFRRARP